MNYYKDIPKKVKRIYTPIPGVLGSIQEFDNYHEIYLKYYCEKLHTTFEVKEIINEKITRLPEYKKILRLEIEELLFKLFKKINKDNIEIEVII